MDCLCGSFSHAVHEQTFVGNTTFEWFRMFESIAVHVIRFFELNKQTLARTAFVSWSMLILLSICARLVFIAYRFCDLEEVFGFNNIPGIFLLFSQQHSFIVIFGIRQTDNTD